MKKVEIFKRERIHKVLLTLYDYPLTIVEAPMGFGKTTAVRSFLKEEKSNPLWVSFLYKDESPMLFWEKFSTEIGKFNPQTSIKLKALGFPIDIPQTETILSLLNEIKFHKKTVFVIDDFHLATDETIHTFLKRIVNENIENLHIVIITRDTTQIDFTELLSRGLCALVSQQKLKFTPLENDQYCRMMVKNISEADILKINTFTDGWISLIYMILLGLENGIPVGLSDSVNDLINKGLFKTYDESLQKFLMKLSLMTDFSAEQALFVTHEEKTFEILKKLRKENAFVYYDQTSQTYKIHNVLLDFLRMEQSYDSKERCALYNRLGEWHLLSGDFPNAYTCFYQAGNVEKILAHLDNPVNIRSSLTNFEGASALFDTAPRELLYQYPIAYLQYLLLSIMKGDHKTISDCERQLAQLKKAYENRPHIDASYRNRILAEILIFKRFTAFNQIEPTNESNDEILRLLNGAQSSIMGRENEFTFGSPHLIYVYFRDRGTFKQISELAVSKFSTYTSFANGCGAGSEYLIPAEYALETGDLETAEQESIKAIYSAKTKAQHSIIICANFTRIRLYLSQGKIFEALDLLKQLETDTAALNNSTYNTTIDMCKGYIYACLGQLEKVPFWLQTGDMSAANFLYQGIAFNYIVYGKAVMLSKNYIALEVLTHRFHEQFSEFNNQLGLLHNAIFIAIAKYNLYGTNVGLIALEQALAIAQADDLIMPFVENAPHLMDLLKTAAQNDLKNAFIQKVILYSKQYLEGLKTCHPDKVKLTKRELEILALTAEGLKREDIAVRLFLSQGTVKTHLKNIYTKLEVNSKTAAIRAAQLNGLI